MTEYIKKFNTGYRKNDSLTRTCEKVHEYLKIIVNFCIKGRYVLIQYNTLKNFQLELLVGLKGSYKGTLVPDSLFKENLDTEKLDEESKNQYYFSTAKYLYFK